MGDRLGIHSAVDYFCLFFNKQSFGLVFFGRFSTTYVVHIPALTKHVNVTIVAKEIGKVSITVRTVVKSQMSLV